MSYSPPTSRNKPFQLLAEKSQGADPEDPDEHRAANVFWVPKEARWAHLQSKAKQPAIGKLLDDAMLAIERDNKSLKGVLSKEYARPALDKQRLGELILARAKKNGRFRDRRKETLFIDARKMGALIDRVHRDLTTEDIERIAGTYHAWRGASTGTRPTSRRKRRRPSWSKPKCSAPIGRRNHVSRFLQRPLCSQFPVTSNFTIKPKHLTIVPGTPRSTMELITMSDLHKLESNRGRQRALKHPLLPRRAEVPNERGWPEELATPGNENAPLRPYPTFNNLRAFSEEPNPISEHLPPGSRPAPRPPTPGPRPPTPGSGNCILPANMVISIGNRRLSC
jgi:hypothetical protein